MPLTPYHLGPGAAVKVVAGRYLSFTLFALVQVIVDLEVLFRIFAGSTTLPGWFHTLLGATSAGLITAAVGKPVLNRLVQPYNRYLAAAGRGRRWLLRPVSWTAAVIGSLLGAWSHVLLDSLLYPDMAPLAPFSEANPMLYAMAAAKVHLLCLVSGIFGGAVLAARWVVRGDTQSGCP